MTAIKCLILFFGGLGLFLSVVLPFKAAGITLSPKVIEFVGMLSLAVPYYYLNEIYNWINK